MKNRAILLFGIAGWLTAGYFAYATYTLGNKLKELNTIVVKSNKIFDKELPKVAQGIKEIKEAVDTEHNDTSRLPVQEINGSNLDKKMDTVQLALEKQLKDQFKYERKSMRDSIDLFRSRFINATTQLALATAARRNIIVQNVKPGQQGTNKDAFINFYEFATKRNPKSLFSPERNYLRITNSIDTFKVNNLPYYDYELRNDNIYQLMLQLRGAYNPSSNRSSVGVGAELKINNVSINAVLNFNSRQGNQLLEAKQPRFTPAFGIRYDIFKFPFN